MNKKVVITGISGCIGRILYENLKDRWDISGISRREAADLPMVQGDICDYEKLAAVFKDAYAVIHLAANAFPGAAWNEIEGPNITGTVNVFEAARNNGVAKVIFASSNHVTALYEQDEPYRSIIAGEYSGLTPSDIPQIDHTSPIRPDGYYGISKAFGEALGRFYADTYGMQVICLRIGSVNRQNNLRNIRQYATLLTHNDLVALTEKCLENQEIRFEIFYGVSNNKWKFWDTDHIRDCLGWSPRESAATQL